MGFKEKFKYITFENLTYYEKEMLRKRGILNGYGGAGEWKIVRWIIGKLLGKFKKAIADKHDYGYWLAIVTRSICDKKFFSAMIEDMVDIYNRDEDIVELVWNFYLCLLAYGLIRLLGWRFYGK